MPTIYISDSGDDKNDGLSLQTAVYSLKRAKKLQGGRNDYSWHFGPRAWKRIQKELSDKKRRATRETLEAPSGPSPCLDYRCGVGARDRLRCSRCAFPIGSLGRSPRPRGSSPSSVGLGLSPQLGGVEAKNVRPVKRERVPLLNGCLHNLCGHPCHLQGRCSPR